ncbi:MAG: hypothetical protein PVH62_00845 [Anaerolineae bacterium]|jgi:hypothetical protein
MGDPLEWLAHLDLISRVEGFVSTFLNADWRGAAQRSGVLGVLGEVVDCVTFRNTWPIYVPRDCPWRGIDIERFLARYGVRIWDRGFTREYLTFRVKRRQANWAEYLLWRRGIPVCSRPFNPANRLHGLRHLPGSAPPTSRSARTSNANLLDRFLSFLL